MNMKATLRLWWLMTTLAFVTQQASAEPYTDTRILQPQDNSLLSPAKRTKASLSIVNPLDVLRQRIILEMARRRMQENSMQVARNKAILREIGKRTLSEYPQEETPLYFGSQDGLHYEKLPFLRGYSYTPDHQMRGIMEYDLEPVESRKATGIASRDTNAGPSSADEAVKQINNHKDINSSGTSSRSGGELTLAAEQRQLEREQQTQQEANGVLHSFADVGPREIKFSNERVLLPNGVGANAGVNDDDNDDDDEDDDGGNRENDVDDGDEYFPGSVFPSGREQNHSQQQHPQKDDRLKSDDYRLRYLYRIQGKYFG